MPPAVPIKQAPPEKQAPAAVVASPTPASRTYANTIAVLPSSLPDFHRVYMEGNPRPLQPEMNAQSKGEVNIPPLQGGPLRSQEEQHITTARLKPHARGSQINLDKVAKRPDNMTPLPAKKPRTTKWQFGIRSRNTPAEAMLALYKALQAMNADWEVPKARTPRARSHSGSSRGSRDDDDEEEPLNSSDEEDGKPFHRTNSSDRGRTRAGFGPHNDWGYKVPSDPWVIHARFRKEGLYPPGAEQGSAHSSRVDLTSVGQELARKRLENDANVNAGGISNNIASYSGPGSNRFKSADGTDNAEPDESAYVYMTIQLYTIEKDFYLVDFKCAGYERLAREVVKEVRTELENGAAGPWRRINDESLDNLQGLGDEYEVRETEVLNGSGRENPGEKKVTSAFPFLDVASRLVAELADGGSRGR
jgi:carbon catabolite-derepressing protein kinase